MRKAPLDRSSAFRQGPLSFCSKHPPVPAGNSHKKNKPEAEGQREPGDWSIWMSLVGWAGKGSMDLEQKTEASPQDRLPAGTMGTSVMFQLSLPATVTLEATYRVGSIIKTVELSLSLINLA